MSLITLFTERAVTFPCIGRATTGHLLLPPKYTCRGKCQPPTVSSVTCAHLRINDTSESPARTFLDKTAIDLQAAMDLSKELSVELWPLVDAEMAAIRERLSKVEGVIEQLHRRGIQHPGFSGTPGDGSFSAISLGSGSKRDSRGSMRRREREAWWHGGSDSDPPPTRSTLSSPHSSVWYDNPLSSEDSGSSSGSGVHGARRNGSFGSDSRSLPRRHWLSPLYRRDAPVVADPVTIGTLMFDTSMLGSGSREQLSEGPVGRR